MSKYVDSASWASKHSGKADEMEERFGVNVRSGAGYKSDSGESYEEYRRSSNWHNDMVDAARNDYDLRRTLEAAAMSGKSKAKKILDKGFNNLDDVSKAMNFSEKAAKRHGQGGDFSSNSDYMGLTQSMVKRDRNKQTQAINDQVNSLRDEFMAKISEQKETQVADEEVTTKTSSRLADARNAVSEMENGMFGGVNQHTAPDEGQQNDSIAQQMLAEKKKQIADQLKPANPAGL